MTLFLVITFKNPDIMKPQPWPIYVDEENFVTSGLGEDDGATFIGFAPKGETRFRATVREFDTLNFDEEDVVPVFVKDEQMFNWNIPIKKISAVEI